MTNPLPPLSPTEFEELKTSILRVGVICPVIVQAGTGVVIEGHTRMLIADELGVPCPTRKVETDDPEGLGIVLNVARRHMTRKDRSEVIRRLKEETGMSTRQIAELTAVSQTCVQRTPTESKDSVDDPAEPLTPTTRQGNRFRKTSKAEMKRRGQMVAKLRTQGASIHQIQNALGVAANTVHQDLLREGIPRSRRSTELPVDPAPFDWHDDAPEPLARNMLAEAASELFVPPPEVPDYLQSMTVRYWREIAQESKDNNFVNKFSHDAVDAEEANDTEWFDEARRVFTDAIAYAQRLLAVTNDKDARQRGMRWDERDDMAKPVKAHIRAVKSR